MSVGHRLQRHEQAVQVAHRLGGGRPCGGHCDLRPTRLEVVVDLLGEQRRVDAVLSLHGRVEREAQFGSLSRLGVPDGL